uniref:J domain-containing protein n=1 Tax=Kalanchoe fedtschenkoi TaxID=63787 RepID=A0A7N1A448_KALFE
MQNPNSAARSGGEGERLLAIAEKLLQSRDLVGARDFAILAQENDPLLEGSDQILAISEVLISSEKRINDRHNDWYSILQIDRRSDDLDLIKKQYRRLALLLHPDKNKFPFADQAFQLVADAWATLSDPPRKAQFDQMLVPFTRVDLASGRSQTQSGFQYSQAPQSQGFQMDFSSQPPPQNQQHQEKLPVRRGEEGDSRSKQKRSATAANGNGNGNLSPSFWTACPYCFMLYEYPRIYEDCGLRCQKCERAFHGAEIPALPPLVPGNEAYYCCWASFPVGFKDSNARSGSKGFPNWMPPMFDSTPTSITGKSNPRPAKHNSQPSSARPQAQSQQASTLRMGVEMSFGVRSADDGTKKKRGRPRKYPFSIGDGVESPRNPAIVRYRFAIMKRKHPSNGANEETEKGDIKHVFCEPSEGVKLGDLIWVKLHPSSWWPAQVVDADTVSECVKPSERLVGEVLVRVYGSYIYLYVDPSESRAEFEKVLKRYDGNRDAIIKESLHKDRPRPTKSKGLVVSEVSQPAVVGSELISDVKPEDKYITQGNEEDDLSSTVISDIVAEHEGSRPHCAMKKKSKNKKTAVVDNKTSAQRQRNISARAMLARMKLESDFENGNLESEASSPTLIEKTSDTKRKSQSTKPETESADLSLKIKADRSSSSQCTTQRKRAK